MVGGEKELVIIHTGTTIRVGFEKREERGQRKTVQKSEGERFNVRPRKGTLNLFSSSVDSLEKGGREEGCKKE